MAELPAKNLLVGVDGYSGSGKTTFATDLATFLQLHLPAESQVQICALECFYPGWDGLAAGCRLAAEQVLSPWKHHRIGRARTWDWTQKRPGLDLTFAPASPRGNILLVEGCGALGPQCGPLLDIGIWIAAAQSVRRHRALSRDGNWDYPWDSWHNQERALQKSWPWQHHADWVIFST